MKAVILTGGKQYLVSKGDKISVELLPGEKGGEVTFDKVLMIEGEKQSVGTPYLTGAVVAGKILAQIKNKKVIAFKYKRRKGYHKIRGHRQMKTQVEITGING